MLPRICLRSSFALAFLAGCLLFRAAPVDGQTLDETISTLAGENAALYVEPITDGFGHAMTFAFFDGARPRGLLRFNLGVRIMAAIPPEELKTFTPILPATVMVEGEPYPNPYTTTGTSPTATGAGPGLIVEPNPPFRQALLDANLNPDNYNLVFPEGLDIPAVPFATIEGTVGVGMGTQVNLRVVPGVELSDEIGSVSAFGIGVQHSLTNWLLVPPPVDVSVSAGMQSLSAGDFLEVSGRSLGLAVSRTLGAITLFAKGAVLTSSMDLDYEVSSPHLETEPRVRLSSDLGSKGRIAAGAHLQLAFFSVSGQFATSEYNTASIRVGVGMP